MADKVTYQIVDFNNEDILINGNYNNLQDVFIIKKIEAGLKAIDKPWKESIPWFKNCLIGFISYDALKQFLFGQCQLNNDDIKELNEYGVKVIKNEVECYSNGLSKIRGTYFKDEIINSEIIDIREISKSYKPISKAYVSSDDIKYTKDRYYKNVKLFN